MAEARLTKDLKDFSAQLAARIRLLAVDEPNHEGLAGVG